MVIQRSPEERENIVRFDGSALSTVTEEANGTACKADVRWFESSTVVLLEGGVAVTRRPDMAKSEGSIPSLPITPR